MQNRKLISIRLPPAALTQLDAYRAEFEFPPQRTTIIVEAVKRYLAEQKTKTPAPKKK